jgi:FtsP/CotA-like multicopper oxidase with cupredoxin domain
VNANGFELAPGNRLDVALSLDSAEEGDVFLISDTFTRQSNLLGTIEVMGEPIGNRMQLKAQGKAVNWRAANSLPPDETYRLNAQRGGHMQIEWTIDGAAFPDTETTRLKHGEFNKLRYINESGRLHPMHLHGQFFKVLARNGQPVNEPYFRDTVLVHSKETVDIGLIPFDKGKWAHHCHILEHAEAGMLNIIEVL